MHKTVLLIGLLLYSLSAEAQLKVEVPKVIYFADIQLELTPEAQKKIQTDVDALTRYEKYFNAKVDKVDAHLPLIEQMLREENVPDDIKYLVIQESALVGDAVSSSNAVGYWQFKAPTGREVGLTINNEVDERMNIITATRGAARYFKNNNTFFDNWLYALLAYYAGPGGALKIADKKYYGAKRMKLDGRTHWYVIKYLAHKLAFEQAVGKNPNPEMILFAYDGGNGKTLAQVAKEFKLEESELEPYNKWIRKNRIPIDKEYFVIIPDYSATRAEPLLAQTTPSQEKEDQSANDRQQANEDTRYVNIDNTAHFPLVKQGTRWGKKVTLINGIPGVIADNEDNIRSLSRETGVAPSKLVKFNDLTSKNSGVITGNPYYTKRKRNKAPVHYHVVEPEENLWSISQRFGIKLKKLMRNNRMREEEALKPGRVLWLRFIRPPHIPVEYRNVPNAKPQWEKSKENIITQKQAAPSGSPLSKEPELNSSVNQQQGWEIQEDNNQPEDKRQKPASKAEENIPSSDDRLSTDDKRVNPGAQEEKPGLVPSVSTESQGNSTESEYHIVKAGETLYSIARQYDLTIPQLTSYNNIAWDIPLKVGQKLLLNAQDAAQQELASSTDGSNFLVHEVKVGETMYKVARQYDVTIKELMEWNEKEDFNVSVGEKLRVRKK
ncbi:membrane-bound lytic murein transglycosylase D [Catalinimonas alkaloidigena]|uniref:LysM peptidoglycan-binding domain-containing protein n=1 Tax=Catalinimonas alkaloidigena TaxID=1075417 RepID=UPI002405CF94|nr:LysM peptidoglycan-binding domain-containing protein [Catalinimonas alkaloidigena]MDF9800299.1 membrane-bound lytic murein transglycosylase D [Catalinimonas alkaloidigena]